MRAPSLTLGSSIGSRATESQRPKACQKMVEIKQKVKHFIRNTCSISLSLCGHIMRMGCWFVVQMYQILQRCTNTWLQRKSLVMQPQLVWQNHILSYLKTDTKACPILPTASLFPLFDWITPDSFYSKTISTWLVFACHRFFGFCKAWRL